MHSSSELKRIIGKLALFIVAGVGLLLAVLFLYVLYHFVDWGHGNQAEHDLKPIMSRIEQSGGEIICSKGDNGDGLDNNKPWHEVYYRIADSRQLQSEIMTTAAQSGFQLHENRELISQLKYQTYDSVLPSEDEKFSPSSDYLISEDGQTKLYVNIHRSTEVALLCGTGEYYGRKISTGDGAIVNISLILPADNN